METIEPRILDHLHRGVQIATANIEHPARGEPQLPFLVAGRLRSCHYWGNRKKDRNNSNKSKESSKSSRDAK